MTTTTDAQDFGAESVTVTLIAAPATSGVYADIDQDTTMRIVDEVIEAAFAKAHELLEEVEGFKRYGDIGPDEAYALEALGSLLVRSVLANGRMGG
jgi:hypothetical protein